MAGRDRTKRRRGALNRPLGVLTICVVVAWAAALALGPQQARAADQARPVIDTDFLYHQLYYMSSNFLYRVSGQDGDPTNPADPANQPPQLNGWQEFYAYWKKTMTDPKQMGPLGRGRDARRPLLPVRRPLRRARHGPAVPVGRRRGHIARRRPARANEPSSPRTLTRRPG